MNFEYAKFEIEKARSHAVENNVPVVITVQIKGAQRCQCGRYKGKNQPCSLEHEVYEDGSFMGWEHE